MGTEEIVQKLISGKTVTIVDPKQKEEVYLELLEIQSNCKICLAQLKEANYFGKLRGNKKVVR